jgi:SAM-dependent methyltransferase
MGGRLYMSEVADRLNTLKSRLTLMGAKMREFVSFSFDAIVSVSLCALVRAKRSVERILRNGGHRLITLNERLNSNALTSCWFKRDLSVVKRSVEKILRNEGHRLSTLNERLNLNALTSCWFKRGLSVIKRLETAFDRLCFGSVPLI